MKKRIYKGVNWEVHIGEGPPIIISSRVSRNGGISMDELLVRDDYIIPKTIILPDIRLLYVEHLGVYVNDLFTREFTPDSIYKFLKERKLKTMYLERVRGDENEKEETME